MFWRSNSMKNKRKHIRTINNKSAIRGNAPKSTALQPLRSFFGFIFNRLNLVFFCFVIFSGLLISQLIILQLKNGGYYEVLALGQQVDFGELRSGRGNIFFGQSNLALTQAKNKNIVFIFPERLSLPADEKEVGALADILEEKKEDLIGLIQKGEVIKKEIKDSQADVIKKRNFSFVSPERTVFRFYPQQRLAANVLGFVSNDGIGQYGLEGYYDKILSSEGVGGRKTRSPLGYLPFFSAFEEDTLVRGADISLTLDYNIQYFAEKLLSQANQQWGIDAGEIIVEEPFSGKILALAAWPSFDPNDYGKERDLEVFRNSAVQKTFEPGSVFKPVVMAAGLQEGLVTRETKYEDKGYIDVGGPLIYNFDRRVWGEQTMEDVLEESINTGVIFVEEKLGKDLFLKYIEKFGFFEKTNIDLQGEVFSQNNNLKNGYPRDYAVASFGQGIEVTPISLIRAFGAIANNGKMMKPYVVERIVTSDGEEKIIKPEVEREVISKTTAETLTAMLAQVVEAGSARRAQIKGYNIAGKTGTAQVAQKTGGYSEDKTVQSFIGYFPVESPQFLVLVKLDNPKGVRESSRCAVPLARELIKYIIDVRQIAPNVSTTEAVKQ